MFRQSLMTFITCLHTRWCDPVYLKPPTLTFKPSWMTFTCSEESFLASSSLQSRSRTACCTSALWRLKDGVGNLVAKSLQTLWQASLSSRFPRRALRAHGYWHQARHASSRFRPVEAVGRP